MPRHLPLRRALCASIMALLLAGGAGAQQAPAAQSARDSAVKAAFLYKFPSFVEWPAGTFANPAQPFVIGVIGDDPVAAELEQLVQGRTIDGRPITVRRVAESAAVSGVHVLFIASRRDARLKEIIDAVAGPVLIVTEQPGARNLGSVLNFVEDEGHIRFAASLMAAEARKLKLSARLLAVAQDVEGRAR
jgi:hypothetical protein